MKSKVACGLTVLSLLLTSGCVFIGSIEDGKASLPPQAVKVAGGYDITYLVPEDGTIILMDQKSRKHIMSSSMTGGTEFKFSAQDADKAQYKKWGIDVNKADFVLYFHPKLPKVQPVQPAEAPQQPEAPQH